MQRVYLIVLILIFFMFSLFTLKYTCTREKAVTDSGCCGTVTSAFSFQTCAKNWAQEHWAMDSHILESLVAWWFSVSKGQETQLKLHLEAIFFIFKNFNFKNFLDLRCYFFSFQSLFFSLQHLSKCVITYALPYLICVSPSLNCKHWQCQYCSPLFSQCLA